MSNRAQIRFIRDTFTKTDTKPPRAVAAAVERAAQLTAKLEALTAPDGGVAKAFTDALLADRDPYTDPDVIAAVVASHVSQGGHAAGIDNRAEQHIADAITAHADECIDIWRKAFDEDAATLATAYAHIGDHDLDQSDTILRIGGDAAEWWSAARKANTRIEAILDGWAQLGGLTSRASLRPHIRLTRIPDAAPERIVEFPRDARLSAWDALRTGLTLSLPSFDEAKERDAQCADYQEHASEAYQSGIDKAAARPWNFLA